VASLSTSRATGPKGVSLHNPAFYSLGGASTKVRAWPQVEGSASVPFCGIGDMLNGESWVPVTGDAGGGLKPQVGAEQVRLFGAGWESWSLLSVVFAGCAPDERTRKKQSANGYVEMGSRSCGQERSMISRVQSDGRPYGRVLEDTGVVLARRNR